MYLTYVDDAPSADAFTIEHMARLHSSVSLHTLPQYLREDAVRGLAYHFYLTCHVLRGRSGRQLLALARSEQTTYYRLPTTY